ASFHSCLIGMGQNFPWFIDSAICNSREKKYGKGVISLKLFIQMACKRKFQIKKHRVMFGCLYKYKIAL
ncbi:hypothetical protein ACJX0J_030949, partial [Zea mays]